MRSLTKSEIGLLGFPDAEVLEFDLDMQDRFFSVSCDDGHLETHDGGWRIHQVVFKIESFESLKIKEFSDGKMTLIDNYSTDLALKDICEFSVGLTDITLKGFSKMRGLWTEYVFSGGDQSAYFEY